MWCADTHAGKTPDFLKFFTLYSVTMSSVILSDPSIFIPSEDTGDPLLSPPETHPLLDPLTILTGS